jgi:hypothetical protein
MHRLGALTLGLMAASAICAPLAADESIVRWVDAEGVTHYGNAQLAPANATAVSLAPANGMVAPTGGVSTQSRSSGPVWTVIDRQPKQNRIGWRTKGEGPNSGPVSPPQR